MHELKYTIFQLSMFNIVGLAAKLFEKEKTNKLCHSSLEVVKI